MLQQTPTEVRGFSRAVHVVDALTSRASVATAVFAIVVATVGAISVVGFTSDLQYVFTTFAAAVTLVMVFVIQHTQSRQLLALQIKLDELVRAQPGADDRFVHVEGGSDDEMDELGGRLVEHHAAVRDDVGSPDEI